MGAVRIQRSKLLTEHLDACWVWPHLGRRQAGTVIFRKVHRRDEFE